MLKYCCFFEGIMRIKELNEIALSSRSNFEKLTNTFNGVKIFDSIKECIKDLGSYSKPVILPDNTEVIPDYINYPNMQDYYVLKPVRFPIFETVGGINL